MKLCRPALLSLAPALREGGSLLGGAADSVPDGTGTIRWPLEGATTATQADGPHCQGPGDRTLGTVRACAHNPPLACKAQRPTPAWSKPRDREILRARYFPALNRDPSEFGAKQSGFLLITQRQGTQTGRAGEGGLPFHSPSGS